MIKYDDHNICPKEFLFPASQRIADMFHPHQIQFGERNDYLFKQGCKIRGEKGASKGEIYQFLQEINKAFDKQLSDDEVWKITESCCRYPPDNIDASKFLPQINPRLFAQDKIPKGCFSDSLVTYAEEVGKSIGVEPSMVFSAILTVLSTAIGKEKTLKIKKDYLITAVLWIVIIASSGSKKSPLFKAVSRVLTQKQLDLNRRYKEAQKEHNRKVAEYKKMKKEWDKSKSTSEPPPDLEPSPSRQFVKITKVTVEALLQILGYCIFGILLYVDEFSEFLSFGKHNSGKAKSDRSTFLSLYDGNHEEVVTKTAGCDSISNPFVTVLGGIQPKILQEELTTQNVASGLIPRMLFCMPQKVLSTDLGYEVSEKAEQEYNSLVQSLLEDTVEINYVFSNEAKVLFNSYRQELEEEMIKQSDDTHSAFYAKNGAIAGKLTLILHCCESLDSSEISYDTTQKGIRLAKWFLNEQIRVIELLSGDSAIAKLKSMYDSILTGYGGEVKPSEWADNHKNGNKQYKAKEAKADLDMLVEAGLAEWIVNKPPTGRSSKILRLISIEGV